jgi:integral membrane protein (TIGR01906 family)
MFGTPANRELGLLRTLLIGAFILLAPLALVTTTIRAAVSEQALYDYSVRQHDAERVSGIPEEELIRANGEIHRYLTAEDPAPLSIQVTNIAGDEETLFTAEETIHMQDVRSLVQTMFTVQVLAVAAILTLVVVMIALWPVRVLAAAMLWGAVFTGVVMAAMGVLAVTGFDAAWSQFHGIAFTNDLWQLDPDTDHLIQMYPEAFWQEATLLIGGLIMLQVVIIAAVFTLYLVFTRDRSRSIEARPRPSLEHRDAPRRPRLAPPHPRHYIQ